jgi:SSS family solute:Na+ symporter
VDNTGAFFVAGRSLGPILIFATVMAANIGAGSTVGAAGLGYRDGLAAWWWVGSAGIGTLVLAWVIGPRIWRVARHQGLLTLGDYLEWRYGPSVRGAVAVMLWLVTLAILSGQLIGIAWILNVVADVPKPLACLIGGLVTTVYFTAGGLLTSAWVNLVQLCVMIVGFTLALPLLLSDAGGWAGMLANAPTDDGFTNLWRGGGSGIVYLALLGPAFVVSPGLIQKVYGARDERSIRVGLTAAALALMAFAAIPPVLGMLAHGYDPALASPEMALPLILVSGLPAALGMLTLAAILSAEMSSADAVLFMLSTSLSKDLYQRFLKPSATDAETLRVARIAAVTGGVAATGLALLLPSVIDSLTVFYSLLTVALTIPIVAGLFSRRPGVPEALCGIGAGTTALISGVMLLESVPGSLMNPVTLGLVLSAVGFGAAYLGRRTVARH